MRDALRKAFEDNKGMIALGGAFMLGVTLATNILGFTTRIDAIEVVQAVETTRLDAIEDLVAKLTVNVCLLTKLETGGNVLECNIETQP